MTWNYRVFHRYREDYDEHEYTIREAFYDEAGDMISFTKEGAEPTGSTLSELSADLLLVARAFDKPVVELNADGSDLADE